MTSPDPVVMPLFEDDRGKLSFGEIGAQLPFAPKRYFLVYDVSPGAVRGGHAHRRCGQFLVAVSGCVVVVTDDGSKREEHRLDQPDRGLHIPPASGGSSVTWAAMHGCWCSRRSPTTGTNISPITRNSSSSRVRVH